MRRVELHNAVHKWCAENRRLLNYDECYGIDIEASLCQLVSSVLKVQSINDAIDELESKDDGLQKSSS
jgi:hypothetical protein